MGQRIELNMVMSEARKIQKLGRSFYKDNSLGIPQAAYVLLHALASGEYKLAKVRAKPKGVPAKEKPDKPE